MPDRRGYIHGFTPPNHIVNVPETHIIRHRHLRLRVTRHTDDPHQPDLLMLHGFLGSGDQFLHLIPGLADLVNPVTLDFFDERGEESGERASDESSTGDHSPFHEYSLVQ